MMWMVTILDLQCESLRLHLVFDEFNIPLLIMFDKNILLDCNIIKRYLIIVFCLNIFALFVLCVFFVFDFVLD